MAESIPLTRLDPTFKYEVSSIPGGENIRLCFQCGTCAAGCPVSEMDARYNPRRIIRQVVLGMREEVLENDFIWLCSSCYTCQERCPQDVRITEVMTALRNLAVKEGHIHPAFRKQAELIGAFGKLFELEDFDNKKRQRSGLPALEKRSADIEKIFKACHCGRFLQAATPPAAGESGQ